MLLRDRGYGSTNEFVCIGKIMPLESSIKYAINELDTDSALLLNDYNKTIYNLYSTLDKFNEIPDVNIQEDFLIKETIDDMK